MNNRYIFNAVTLTDADCTGEFKYEQCVNPGTDLQFGTTAMGELRFAIFDTNNISATLKGQTFQWQLKQMSDSAYKSMGRFTVDSVRKLRNRTEIIAYDDMIKFERYVDDWLTGLTFPITLGNMLTSLCAYCGVTLGTTINLIINYAYIIKNTFTGTNITGKVILSYICEVAASFACIDTAGRLSVQRYANTIALDASKYISLEHAEYTVQGITKVQVRSGENDIGVIEGTGTNTYIIENNPLFYATTAADISNAVKIIYNTIPNFLYTPMTFTTFEDYGIKCGNWVTVDGMQTVIMDKQITQSGVRFESTGNMLRAEQSTRENQTIKRLQGNVHEFINEIDRLSSKIYDAEGHVSELTQTVNSFDVRIQSIETSAGQAITAVTNMQSKVDKNAAQIEFLASYDVQSTDNFKIGPTSQTNGMTAANAAKIPAGTMYYPTVQHTESLPVSTTFVPTYVWRWYGTEWVPYQVAAQSPTPPNASYWYVTADYTENNITYYTGHLYIGHYGSWLEVTQTQTNQTLAKISQVANSQGANISLLASRVTGAESTVASLSATVSQNSANIALIAQTGTMTGSMIIGAINSESYAIINASRISLSGKNINLTSDNITISSNYFNVDRYGNLTATSGTFTGTVNATGGTINGALYFGGNSNFYLSGSGTYRLYMYYSSNRYVTINSNGILAADSCVFQTCTIGAELRIGSSGSYYGRLQYTSEFEISSTQGLYITGRYINMTSTADSIELNSGNYINLDAPFISLYGDVYINGVRIY